MTKIDRKNLVVFCDMDGVLVDFMGGVVSHMNETIERVAAAPNKYKERQPGLYKAIKKAVQELDGDLDAGKVGEPVTFGNVGKTSPDMKPKVRSLMYTLVSNNRSWWAQLDWMPGGRELWEYIEGYRPIICTGPMGPNSKKGKTDWVKRELGLGRDRIVCTHTKHEEIRSVAEEGKVALLIDDLPKYVVPWRNAGGVAIHHQFENPQATLEELQRLGL